jgi:hypothetical protein
LSPGNSRAVIFLRATDGSENGSRLSSIMAGVAASDSVRGWRQHPRLGARSRRRRRWRNNKPVADDRAVWIEAALGEPGNRGCTEAGDPAQLQPNRLSLGGGLDGGDERRLTRRPPASLSAGTFAPEIGIVDLDPAGFSRLVASRSSITCFSLCLIFQAVVCVRTQRRCDRPRQPQSGDHVDPATRWRRANRHRSGTAGGLRHGPAVLAV